MFIKYTKLNFKPFITLKFHYILIFKLNYIFQKKLIIYKEEINMKII